MQRPHTSHSRHQSGSNNSRMNHYHHHHSSNQLNSSNEAAVTPPRGYHATVGPGNAAEGQPYQYEGGPLTVLPPPPAPSYHHQVCSMQWHLLIYLIWGILLKKLVHFCSVLDKTHLSRCRSPFLSSDQIRNPCGKFFDMSQSGLA